MAPTLAVPMATEPPLWMVMLPALAVPTAVVIVGVPAQEDVLAADRQGRLDAVLARHLELAPAAAVPEADSPLGFHCEPGSPGIVDRQILREVWGPTYVEQTHYLRVYMAHLREKLEANPAQPERFITEPGVGYRLLPG